MEYLCDAANGQSKMFVKTKYLSKLCKFQNCYKFVKNNKVCQKHGAVIEYCESPNCNKRKVQYNLCFRHIRQKYPNYRKCKILKCKNIKQKNGLCARHYNTIDKNNIIYILN